MGQYHDTETGLYYLQSRYYDPEVGRFLNTDAFTSTGQGILGNNMFAYCGNNPVNCSDPSGTICQICLGNNHNSPDMFFMSGGGGGGRGASSSNSGVLQEVIENIIADINNTDPEVVLEAENIAFYRGTVVIKAQVLDDSAFSCGIILIGPNANTETLKHEYGHYIHFRQIGLQSYITNVAIPSLIDYWSGTPYDVYYSEPQEYIADMLGDVNRTLHNSPYPYNISPMEAGFYYFYTFIYRSIGG